MVPQADAKEVRDRVLHGDLHVLAAPGPMPLLERREDPDREVHSGAGISDRGPEQGGRAVRPASHAHRPAHGLRDGLEALEPAVGAVSAEAFHGGVDEPRVDLLQHAVAEAEPVERAGREVLHQHVGAGGQLLEQRLAALRLEVQGEAALVGVQDQEEQALAAVVGHVGARDVALFGRLQLDDLGAEPGQHLGAGGTCLVVRHVDDADAVEGARHALSLLAGGRGGGGGRRFGFGAGRGGGGSSGAVRIRPGRPGPRSGVRAGGCRGRWRAWGSRRSRPPDGGAAAGSAPPSPDRRPRAGRRRG